MYGEIVFYTHGSTIEYGGEIFAAGELTADILNFAPEDYRPIQRLLNRMKELARQYEDTLERGVWWELNNQLIELRSQLMRIIPVLIYDIFHIVPCSLRPPLHIDYCDYLYVMSRGAVVAEGTPETILEPDLIRTVFGVESVLVDVPELKRKTIVFVC